MKKLTGILGQERARSQLEAELAAGRLAHAYLFVGLNGSGRATTARALFSAANCHGTDQETACGLCPACRRAQGGGHEDFLVIEPPTRALSSQIKKEEVTQAIRTLFTFSPFAGGMRVLLIREAEHLNLFSANALLKTLEEPPPGNVIILTVQEAGGILPTLVSRCRRVNFIPLKEELIAEELKRRGVDDQSAHLKAGLSGGSLGKALELDQESLAADLERMVSHLSQKSGLARGYAFAEELVRPFRGERIDREGIASLLDLLNLSFRDSAVRASQRPGSAILPPRMDWSQLSIAAAWRAFARVRTAQAQIFQNATPELAVAVLMADLREIVGS